MLRLRKALTEDANSILFLLMRMHRESGMGSVNVDKVERHVRTTLQQGVILIIEDGHHPSAVMGLKISDFWWSDDRAIMDAFTYVAPEARKTRAFRMMFNEAKKMALEAGLPLLMANFGPVDEDRKSKLFKRLGKQLGTTIITGDTSKFLWK